MTAVNQDVGTTAAPWVVGDDRSLVYALTDEDGDALNLSGASFSWALYPWDSASPGTTASISKSSGSGITANSPTSGSVTVAVDASDTSSLSPGRFYAELQMTDSDSKIHTMAVGTVTLTLQRIT